MRVLKYGSPLATALDLISYSMTYPFLLATSSLLCCYLTHSAERGKYLLKALHYLVLGPALVSVTLATLPPYLVGQTLWVVLCHWPGLDKTDFARVDFEQGPGGVKSEGGRFTFVSANVLLGLDFLGKFQNMSFVYRRLWRYWQVLSRYTNQCIAKNTFLK